MDRWLLLALVILSAVLPVLALCFAGTTDASIFHPGMLATCFLAAGESCVLLMIIQMVRRQFSPLTALQDRLLAYRNDPLTPTADLRLQIANDPVAEAWNAFVDFVDELQREAVAMRRQAETLTRTANLPGAWQSAIEALPVGVARVDQSLQLTYVNPAAAKLLQAAPGRMDEFAGADAIALRDVFESLRRTPFGCELRLKWRDGVLGLQRVGSDSDYLTVCITDATRLAQGEEWRRNLMRHLAERGIDPLRGMLQELSGLPTGEGPDDLRRRNAIRGAAGLLEHFERLDRLARIESGQATVSLVGMHLETAVEDARQSVQDFATSRGVEVNLTGPIDTVWVLADRGLLAEALSSLLRHAVANSGRDGIVRVEVQSDDLAARIRISDLGASLPLERHPALFDKFGSCDAQGRDPLRLALAVEILRTHGGSVRVASGPSQGMLFEVELPRAAQRARPEHAEVCHA